MKKNIILLSILTLCLLGLGQVACSKKIAFQKKGNTISDSGTSLSPGIGTGTGTGTGTINEKPKNAEEAFAKVVQVLHAPYANGDYLFKILKDEEMAADIKQGSDDTVGSAAVGGSGSYTVTVAEEVQAKNGVAAVNGTAAIAGCGKGHPITYEYTNYQPKGSLIIVNGSLTGSRTQADSNNGSDPMLQFCKSDDTLTMSGLFDATLKITYPGNARMMKAANMTEKLNKAFGTVNNSMEFTYEGKAMNLTQEQRNQLLHVAT